MSHTDTDQATDEFVIFFKILETLKNTVIFSVGFWFWMLGKFFFIKIEYFINIRLKYFFF